MKKLFVWDGVLCDWKCGIVFALADSLEDAIRTVHKKRRDDKTFDLDFGENGELEGELPRVIEESEGFYLFGSS